MVSLATSLLRLPLRSRLRHATVGLGLSHVEFCGMRRELAQRASPAVLVVTSCRREAWRPGRSQRGPRRPRRPMTGQRLPRLRVHDPASGP